MTTSIRITLTNITVDDQAKALSFYTDKLGFEKARDIPLGEFRWLTVTSPAGVDGVELLLEPDAHPAAKTFQAALRADGIPVTTFFVDDVDSEHERLVSRGVEFKMGPTDMGAVKMAVFDDTCGNWVGLAQEG